MAKLYHYNYYRKSMLLLVYKISKKIYKLNYTRIKFITCGLINKNILT